MDKKTAINTIKQLKPGDFLNWQTIMSVLIPIASTLYLAFNLHEARNLPQMTGIVTGWTIAAIVIVTLLNIVFSLLTFMELPLGYVGLILINLIVVAFGYKYSPYIRWALINTNPIYWKIGGIWF